MCESEENEGLVTILFQRSADNFIDKFFFKYISAKPSKIDLDEIGSFIWKNIDNSLTVRDLITKAQNRFNEKIEPAQQRIILFLTKMAETKLIELYKKR